MYLVKEINKQGGLLCRTELARDTAIKFFVQQNITYEVQVVNSHEIADPQEA